MMADWYRRERTVTTVEYTVPTGPLGTCWSQVQQAIDAAIHDWQLHNGTAEYEPSDDAIRVHSGDDEIVISYVLKVDQ